MSYGYSSLECARQIQEISKTLAVLQRRKRDSAGLRVRRWKDI